MNGAQMSPRHAPWGESHDFQIGLKPIAAGDWLPAQGTLRQGLADHTPHILRKNARFFGSSQSCLRIPCV